MKSNIKSVKEVEIKEPDHELFLPGEVGAVIELTVKKKDGTVREHRIMKSKSFVRQFFDLLLIQFQMQSEMRPMQVRDTSNVLQGLAFSSLNFAANAAIGDALYGILVGTGNTAPIITNYAMETLIAHGVVGVQLQYSNMAFGAPAATATTSHFTLTRDFANGSGGAITVNEVGLAVKGHEAAFTDRDREDHTLYFLMIRDVIGGGIAVPNGETLTVNYREQAVA